MTLSALRTACCVVLVAAAACSEPSAPGRTLQAEPDSGTGGPASDAGTAPDEDEQEEDKGAAVAIALSPSQQAELAQLKQALAAVEKLTANELLKKHALPVTKLSYDPAQAAGLPLIQDSALALRPTELEVLEQHGLVISQARVFSTFAYGYASIYKADLPVFVSADSIMSAIHTSYNDILEQFELALLMPELTSLLRSMRAKLASATLSEQEKEDLDIYLGVAEALLTENRGSAATARTANKIQALVELANAADGDDQVKLFGVERDVDFSQFTVRGHYKNHPALEAYFRCMMWLGRIEFRLIETKSDGSQVFRRRQFDAMLALRSLMDAEALARYETIERVVRAFVGESDNMVLEEVDPLIAALTKNGKQLNDLSDAQIAQALLDGGYGAQAISSQLLINNTSGDIPLSRTFMLFGQRYVVDSHVLSNVSYSRTKEKRMMPDPLDVAFAALGNDSAAPLLAQELKTYAYAPNLESTRILVDAHAPAFWEKNLYSHWLKALRALSPTQEAEDAAGLPEIAQTEAWGRRVLNTQLASWAELRHDTILYAKQSYTLGASCEFPDAYVEPYPEFFAAIETFAAYGKELALLAQHSPQLAERVATYFDNVGNVASILRSMAEQQRIGEPFSAAQLDFINRAVAPRGTNCDGTPLGAEGWYADLFFSNGKALEEDPVIADVHTQYTGPAGGVVGRVLHVAAGYPRLMVVTVDTCNGPRAYAGLASAYHERITQDFERLDDEAWASVAREAEDVNWMSDIVVR